MLPYLVTSAKNRNKLQVIQNKLLKTIYRLPKLTNTHLLHQITNTQTLNNRIKELTIKYISNARTNNIQTVNNLIENFIPYTKNRNYLCLDALYPNKNRLKY